MKKAIYKITNKINGKIYIGQSNNPERRFSEHCNRDENYSSLIHRAIKEYGVKNFDLEILGWYEDYNEKEIEYIQKYRSLVPYGYNISTGGNILPLHIGEKHPMAKITQKEAEAIQKDLMNFEIPVKQILKKHRVTRDIIRHINKGDSWRNENLTYPLRPEEYALNEAKVDKVINLLQNTTLPQKEIARMVGWGRSAVTMINIGKNHHRDNLTYPIRK